MAAGHRPCALCRREDYTRFSQIWSGLHPGSVGAVPDRRAASRRAHRYRGAVATPPPRRLSTICRTARSCSRRTCRGSSSDRSCCVGRRPRTRSVVLARLLETSRCSRRLRSWRCYARAGIRSFPCCTRPRVDSRPARTASGPASPSTARAVRQGRALSHARATMRRAGRGRPTGAVRGGAKLPWGSGA